MQNFGLVRLGRQVQRQVGFLVAGLRVAEWDCQENQVVIILLSQMPCCYKYLNWPG